MLNENNAFSTLGGIAAPGYSNEKPSSGLKSIGLRLESHTFNRAVDDLPDNLINIIPHRGYSKIEIINITFQEGYKNAAGLTIYCNKNFLFNVGRFVSSYHATSIIIPINRYIVLNNQDIEIKANCRRPFKFNLSYQYHNFK